MEFVENILKVAKEFSEIITWEIVLLIVVWVFYRPLTNLINRITKIGKGDGFVETPLPSVQTTKEATQDINELGKIPEKHLREENELVKVSAPGNGADEYMQSFDNPLLKEVEERIAVDLESRNISNQSDKERVLTRALASTQLVLLFERIYAGIWASQLYVLRYLNGAVAGVNISFIRHYYDEASRKYPEWYKEQTFEKWLNYLTVFNLIKLDDSQATITPTGRQFLRYMADAGKPERIYG